MTAIGTDDSIRVMLILNSDQWKNRSVRAIAEHCGVNPKLVRKLKTELHIKNDAIQCSNGRVIRTKHIGKRGGTMPRKLNAKQQDLVSRAADIARFLARKYANEVLDEEELLGVAHISLTVSARYFRKEKGRSWEQYAKSGIEESINRAFSNARKRLRQEGLFKTNEEHEQFAMEQLAEVNREETEAEALVDRFRHLTGIKRVIVEWMAGLDGAEPRSSQEIAKFWNVPLDTAEELISEAKEAMME